MELAGKIVKIRFKRYFARQKLWVFLGKIRHVETEWFAVEGRGIVGLYGPVDRMMVDQELRTLVIPWNNVAHIRILPDSFDIRNIRMETKGARDFIRVDDGPDTSIGEDL